MEDETKNEPAQQQEQTQEPQAKTYSEADYNALQAKLDAVTGQLNDANSKIQSYVDMDIDGIKQSAADWQKKYEAAQDQMQQLEYSTKLDKFVAQQGCKNPIYADYLKRQIESKQLKFDGDTLLGGEDVVKALKKSCPDAFSTEDEKPPIFVDSATGSTNKDVNDEMVRRVMGLK